MQAHHIAFCNSGNAWIEMVISTATQWKCYTSQLENICKIIRMMLLMSFLVVILLLHQRRLAVFVDMLRPLLGASVVRTVVVVLRITTVINQPNTVALMTASAATIICDTCAVLVTRLAPEHVCAMKPSSLRFLVNGRIVVVKINALRRKNRFVAITH